jgi:xanthine dehydrogenase molybdopterin-binding subunit B
MVQTPNGSALYQESNSTAKYQLKDSSMANFAVVGQSVYRKDATQKVTGQVLHVGNIEMPGMLDVAVLRSPYPHARITRIDKSRAEKVPGVAVVLIGADSCRRESLPRG